MSPLVRIATVQMDATPAALEARLARAEHLVQQAAADGAQLVVLPELFNLGYAYTPANFARAEPLNGTTPAWMRQTARRWRVHLVGSLFLQENGQIYNTQLLFAPDGRMWRYDKRYPWGWERAYYRAGRGITVAETDIGRLGLMICWDTAHRGLWRAYAGRVQMMVVSSCPPNVPQARLAFPNEAPVALEKQGWLGAVLRESGTRLFGPMLAQQTAWLRVPLVHAGCTGALSTPVPRPVASLLGYALAAPRLLRYLPRAPQARLESGFVAGARVLDARGHVTAALETNGDAVLTADVALPATPPIPKTPQPPRLLPLASYLVSDGLLPWLMRAVYRRGRSQTPRASHN